MGIRNVCKIPDRLMAELSKMEEGEGVEAVYMAIAHGWVESHLPANSTVLSKAPVEGWLENVEMALELSIPYSPNIFHDEEGWNEYIGEVVGIAADLESVLHEHFSRVVPIGADQTAYVEALPVHGEVAWIWNDTE